MSSFDSEQLPVLLPVYYRRIFPFDLYYRWMSYGNLKKNYFINREFSFTLKDDIYLRYQSFADKTEFENEVVKTCPYKIDIGAVFNTKPSDRRAVASLQALEKELVFDIDMTDYDEVRTCCKETSVCQKCWPFMTVAIKILHRALTEDFGYKHILWVFSGRRGVHCWVCDDSARQLSPTARTAIVQYLTLVQGGEFKSKKVNLKGFVHPSVREALKVVKEYFPSLILNNQDLLATKDQFEKIINMCSDSKLKEKLSEQLLKTMDSDERWEFFTRSYNQMNTKSNNLKKDYLILEEIMLQLCYPRLDVNVSKGLNHLLKAPFCVHPKTGQVCVPIDPDLADEFDPLSVPNVSQLIEEIDLYDAKMSKDQDSANTDKKAKEPDYKKTSIASSYKIFQAFVKKMESSWSKTKMAENDAKMEF